MVHQKVCQHARELVPRSREGAKKKESTLRKAKAVARWGKSIHRRRVEVTSWVHPRRQKGPESSSKQTPAWTESSLTVIKPNGGVVDGGIDGQSSSAIRRTQRPTTTTTTTKPTWLLCVRGGKKLIRKKEQMAPHHTHNTRTHTRGGEGTRFRSWAALPLSSKVLFHPNVRPLSNP